MPAASDRVITAEDVCNDGPLARLFELLPLAAKVVIEGKDQLSDPSKFDEAFLSILARSKVPFECGVGLAILCNSLKNCTTEFLSRVEGAFLLASERELHNAQSDNPEVAAFRLDRFTDASFDLLQKLTPAIFGKYLEGGFPEDPTPTIQ